MFPDVVPGFCSGLAINYPSDFNRKYCLTALRSSMQGVNGRVTEEHLLIEFARMLG